MYVAVYRIYRINYKGGIEIETISDSKYNLNQDEECYHGTLFDILHISLTNEYHVLERNPKYKAIVSWKTERLLWIAIAKNEKNARCRLAQLPTDVVAYIVKYLRFR